MGTTPISTRHLPGALRSPLHRLQQRLPHRAGLQQVCSLALGSDLLPERDGHDDGRELAGRIGNELDISFGHATILRPNA